MSERITTPYGRPILQWVSVLAVAASRMFEPAQCHFLSNWRLLSTVQKNRSFNIFISEAWPGRIDHKTHTFILSFVVTIVQGKHNTQLLHRPLRFTPAASCRTWGPRTPLPWPRPRPLCLGCPCGPWAEARVWLRRRLPPLPPGPQLLSAPS